VSRWIRSIAAAWPLVLSCALGASVITLVTPLAELEAAPEGQVTYAFHVTLAPRWLDPGETESAITPFKVLYAIHDALVKPMPPGRPREPRRIVVDVARRHQLHLRPAPERQIPQQ